MGRLPAAEIEAAVIDQVRGLLRAPEIVVDLAGVENEGGRLERGASEKASPGPQSALGRAVPS